MTHFPNNIEILQKLLDAGENVDLTEICRATLEMIQGLEYPEINAEVIELLEKYSKK